MVTVESALREATSTIRGNIWKLILLIVGLFTPLVLLGVGLALAAAVQAGDDSAFPVILSLFLIFFGLFFLAYLGVQASAQVITVDHLSGRSAKLGRSVRVGLRHILPIFAASVLGALAYALGLVLFIFPGLIVITGLAVTFPAIIFEDLGPMDGLNRSWALTKGYRWKVFLSFAAVYAITYVAMLPVQFLMAGVAAAAGGESSALTWVSFGIGGLAIAAIYLISTAFYCVLPGVLYLRIKEAREGLDISELAAVFE